MFHHMMGFRILIMAAMGLAALYMIHLLAQDYNRIRQPIATLRSFFRLKRELHEIGPEENMLLLDKFNIDWEKILRYDPMGCLQSMTCFLFSGAESENEEAKNIKTLLQYSLSRDPPEKIVSAVKKGFEFKGEEKNCAREYPFCLYSAPTMFKMLSFFSKFFE